MNSPVPSKVKIISKANIPININFNVLKNIFIKAIPIKKTITKIKKFTITPIYIYTIIIILLNRNNCNIITI